MSNIIRETFEKGQGILKLTPTFVPRRFGRAGHRLRLHPDDYFPLGMERGSIKERWFSSVITAFNGPLTAPDEGMSYVSYSEDPKDKFLLRDAVQELGREIIGDELYDKYGTWPMYSKFFDYETPLFHHVHLREEDAQRVGKHGKPESYYFPPQLNNYPGTFPATYFGFSPDVTKEQVKERLLQYKNGDNKITELSRAYRIQLGTGWFTPAGVIHAPGSYLTYEPQWNSDVNSVYENIVEGEIYPYEMLVENCPADKWDDMDYVISLLDWDKNVDPDYRKHFFRPPLFADGDETYTQNWISYANDYVAAKELTVNPGCTAVVRDSAAYGCIILQGRGQFGPYSAGAASMLRFGQLSDDEYFVSEKAAKDGVVIVNESKTDPIVMLKHFGPNAGAPTSNGL